MTAAFGSRLQIISTQALNFPSWNSVSKFHFSRNLGEVAIELSAHRLRLLLNVRCASSLANVSQTQPRNYARRLGKWLPSIVASCAGIGAAFTSYGYTRGFSIKATSVPDLEKESKEEDLGQPNEAWSPESCTLYNKLLNELAHDDNDWEKLKGMPPSGEHRLFTRAFYEHGKMFEYAFFFCKNKQKVKGVIQFGPYTQGPPGCVHGGAIATMMDTAMGVCAYNSGYLCVTANLSTNYKK